MKRKERKIKVLNATADRLEDPYEWYDWTEREGCNCGHIAKSCGLDVGKVFRGEQISWSSICQIRCGVTGKPFTEVFKALYDNGFEKKDIWAIEYCGNEDVLDRMDLSVVKGVALRSDREFVIRYFREWADMLSEELEIQNAIKESKTLPVKLKTGESTFVMSDRTFYKVTNESQATMHVQKAPKNIFE